MQRSHNLVIESAVLSTPSSQPYPKVQPSQRKSNGIVQFQKQTYQKAKKRTVLLLYPARVLLYCLGHDARSFFDRRLLLPFGSEHVQLKAVPFINPPLLFGKELEAGNFSLCECGVCQSSKVGRCVFLSSLLRDVSHFVHVPSYRSREYPLRTALQKLIHEKSQVREYEAANIETKELGCVPNAQFEANMRRRRVLESWVFDLTRDLICFTKEVSRCSLRVKVRREA